MGSKLSVFRPIARSGSGDLVQAIDLQRITQVSPEEIGLAVCHCFQKRSFRKQKLPLQPQLPVCPVLRRFQIVESLDLRVHGLAADAEDLS